MGLVDWIRGTPPGEERDGALSLQQWVDMFNAFSFNGVRYSYGGATSENIDANFQGVVQGAYKANGVVFACMLTRMTLFSEARLVYRRLRGGRPGDLFAIGNPSNPLSSELDLLRKPWPGGTTGDLLARMIVNADIAGNAYVVRRGQLLTPLRPDWVSIIAGVPGSDASVWSPDAVVLGYSYKEGGPGSGIDPVFFLPEEVAHFAPYPDPEARFRGMSWLTPVIREISADKAMTEHKIKFLENGATPNLAVKLNVDDLEKFKAWIKEIKRNHEGFENAYKTLFLAAGADVTPIGADFQQLTFKESQGAGETRIAAAAGIHPVIVGLSEGLAGSSLNAGNFQAARRLTADRTLRHLWRNACGSLSQIIRVPSDAELWYDARDISFLQEDESDAAAIRMQDAQTISTLVNAGFTAESVVAAVDADDMSLLDHTGLLSVQLQDPTAQPPAPPQDQQPPAPPTPPRSTDDMAIDLLERQLQDMLRDSDKQPINVNVTTPDVHVHPPDIRVEPAQITLEPQITVEPQRFEEGAISVNVEPPRIEPGAVQVTVEPAEAPVVNVNIEPAQVTVDRNGKRRVEFSDGTGAIVTDGDARLVEFDDGRTTKITELPE